MNLLKNVSLKNMNSWQVGGAADLFAAPTSVEDLKEILALDANPTLLGGGTNALISDDGVRGLTIQLSKLSGIEVVEGPEILFTCLAGTAKSDLLKLLLKFRLEAALFIAGIPGTIGGGVAMNAGVGEQISPREFVEIVDWVEVLRLPSLELRRFNRDELQWDYRHCTGWQDGVIVRVGLRVQNDPRADLLDRVRTANRVRASRQPLELPSCGSVFRNPAGDKAGRLIEAAGLKGFTIGGARVSEKHANFIVNGGGSSARDISNVIEHVQSEVERRFGVKLQTEVVRLGKF